MSALRRRMQPCETRARDELGLVGAVDADVAAGRPVGQRRRTARWCRTRPARRTGCDSGEAIADVEVARPAWARAARPTPTGARNTARPLRSSVSGQRARGRRPAACGPPVAAERRARQPPVCAVGSAGRRARIHSPPWASRARPSTSTRFVVPSGVRAREPRDGARAAPTAPRARSPRAAAAPTARRAGRRAAAPARRSAGRRAPARRQPAPPRRDWRRRRGAPCAPQPASAADGERGAGGVRSAGELAAPCGSCSSRRRSACRATIRAAVAPERGSSNGPAAGSLPRQPPDPGGVARLHRVDAPAPRRGRRASWMCGAWPL